MEDAVQPEIGICSSMSSAAKPPAHVAAGVNPQNTSPPHKSSRRDVAAVCTTGPPLRGYKRVEKFGV
jgi:hypothetical protein